MLNSSVPSYRSPSSNSSRSPVSRRSQPNRFSAAQKQSCDDISDSSSSHADSYYEISESSESSQDSYSLTAAGAMQQARAQRSTHEAQFVHNYSKPELPNKNLYVALDCEMVGNYAGESMAARVVVLDFKGCVLLDNFVRPSQPVTDYRTFISGITAVDLESAESLEVVQERVLQLIRGKILVGHGLENDLQCLGITHPWHMIRDTAYYEPFMQLRKSDGVLLPRRLKDLAAEKLRRQIQNLSAPHHPAEDALTALDLYKRHRPRWEACLKNCLKQARKHARQQVQEQLRLREAQYQLMLQQQQQLHLQYTMATRQQQQQQQQYCAYYPQPLVVL